MARQRTDLQTELELLMGAVAGPEFIQNVYFQPPPSVKLKYPCIVYEVDYRMNAFADNLPYRNTKRYQLTVIDRNPDSKIPDGVARLPLNTYVRFFAAGDLNHHIFVLYY